MANNRLKPFFESIASYKEENMDQFPIVLQDALGFLSLSIVGVESSEVKYDIGSRKRIFFSDKSCDHLREAWIDCFQQSISPYALSAFVQTSAVMAARRYCSKPKRYPYLKLGSFTLTVLSMNKEYVHVLLVYNVRIKWIPFLRKREKWDLAIMRKDFDRFIESIGGLGL